MTIQYQCHIKFLTSSRAVKSRLQAAKPFLPPRRYCQDKGIPKELVDTLHQMSRFRSLFTSFSRFLMLFSKSEILFRRPAFWLMTFLCLICIWYISLVRECTSLRQLHSPSAATTGASGDRSATGAAATWPWRAWSFLAFGTFGRLRL